MADKSVQGNEELEKLVHDIEDAKTAMEPLHTAWREDLRYYDSDEQRTMVNEHIKTQDLKHFAVVSNFIFSSTESYVALLMAMAGQPFVVDESRGVDDQTQKLTTYLQALYEVRNVAGEQEILYRQVIPIGNGALKVYWDPNLGDDGDVAVRAISVFSLYPEPGATTLEEGSFLGCRNVYTEDGAKRIWPHFDTEKAEHFSLTEPTEEDLIVDLVQEQSALTERVLYEVWEVYTDFGKKMVIYSGDQVLQKKTESPLGRYPIFLYRIHCKPGRFWGRGLVPDLKDLQKEINKSKTRIAIHQHFSVPKFMSDAPDLNYNADPSEILEVPPGSTVHEFAIPPQLPQGTMEMLEKNQRDFDVISGIQEVTRGIRPKGSTSGVMIESLQEQAQTRLTGPARNWAFVDAQVGQAVLDLMIKNYEGDRSLSLMGEMEPTVVTLGKDWRGEEEEKRKYRVVTDRQARLPLSETGRAEIALQLAQMQRDEIRQSVVDDPTLLRALNFRGAEKMMQQRTQAGEEEERGRQAAGQEIQGQRAEAQATETAQAARAQLEKMGLPPQILQFLDMAAHGAIPPEQVMQFLQQLQAENPQAEVLARQYLASPV